MIDTVPDKFTAEALAIINVAESGDVELAGELFRDLEKRLETWKSQNQVQLPATCDMATLR